MKLIDKNIPAMLSTLYCQNDVVTVKIQNGDTAPKAYRKDTFIYNLIPWYLISVQTGEG